MTFGELINFAETKNVHHVIEPVYKEYEDIDRVENGKCIWKKYRYVDYYRVGLENISGRKGCEYSSQWVWFRFLCEEYPTPNEFAFFVERFSANTGVSHRGANEWLRADRIINRRMEN